jgi:hypothetical protein
MDEVGAVDAGGVVLGGAEVEWIDGDAKAGRAVVVRMVTDRGTVLEPPSITSNTTNDTVTSISTRIPTITAVTRRISRRRSEDARTGERTSTARSDAGPALWEEP